MHRATLLSIALMLPQAALAADRPSAEEVKAAVEKSRQDAIPTKEEFLADLARQLQQAERDRQAGLSLTNRSERTAAVKAATTRLNTLKKQIRDARRSYEPPEPTGELAPFNFHELALGSVGRIVSDKSKYLICASIIGPNEYYAKRIFLGSSGTEIVEFLEAEFIMRGFDTGELIEGQPHRFECDAIVTGQQRFRGETFQVLEKFDPDEPFE